MENNSNAELIEEIQRVQGTITDTNNLIEELDMHLASSLIGGMIGTTFFPTFIFMPGSSLLGLLAKGLVHMITEKKAKEIVLSSYVELAQKQNLLIEEQKRLIIKIDQERIAQKEQSIEDKRKLEQLNAMLENIKLVFDERKTFKGQ